METVVLRLWLPDRPGALGQVASRIGAVRGDVVGIDILERGGGSAIDELTVSLPTTGLLDLLVTEIRNVDGVAVEDVRVVGAEHPDSATAALQLAAAVLEHPAQERLLAFCGELRRLVDGVWSAVLGVDDGAVLASCGEVPDIGWLAAFLEGSRHLDIASDAAPSDMVWAHLPQRGAAIASGRSGRPFHTRERAQVALLGRILDAA